MKLADRLQHFAIHLRLILESFSDLPHRSYVELRQCGISSRDLFTCFVLRFNVSTDNVVVEGGKPGQPLQRRCIASGAEVLIPRYKIVSRTEDRKFSEPDRCIVRKPSFSAFSNDGP